MKYFALIFLASLILSSCNKKNEEPKLPAPDTSNTQGIEMRHRLDQMDKNTMKTHRGTLESLVSLTSGGPIPPNLIPAKEIKLLQETDSTASYSLTGNSGVKGKVELKRRITGHDTIWMATRIEEIR